MLKRSLPYLVLTFLLGSAFVARSSARAAGAVGVGAAPQCEVLSVSGSAFRDPSGQAVNGQYTRVQSSDNGGKPMWSLSSLTRGGFSSRTVLFWSRWVRPRSLSRH